MTQVHQNDPQTSSASEAEHDAWFRFGVEEALAQTAETIPDHEIKKFFSKKRALWQRAVAAE